MMLAGFLGFIILAIVFGILFANTANSIFMILFIVAAVCAAFMVFNGLRKKDKQEQHSR